MKNKRAPYYIDNVTLVLNRIWKKYPELRLMELVGNAIRYGNHFYIGDHNLVKELIYYDKEMEGKKLKRMKKKNK